MEALRDPDITITPAISVVQNHVKTSRSEERIATIFKGVPKELWPRFSVSEHFYSREEVAMAPPMLSLPRVLIPKRGRETPPYLHYGLPISLEKMTSLARSREPNVEIITEFGFVTSQARELAAQCLAEEIGWPVYVEGVLNAPNTPFIVCMIESYTMEERGRLQDYPTWDHIRQIQRTLEVDPNVRPLWYIASAYYTWR
ncbi:hypothetical protein HETIRDRAFT_318355 [Heterobasidion irregulare TC 32-1]|uniref:Uncharacterized protein n=1 Tax=Heterobasidion irregulare (strain TC 32-1) TaxID=747525 RepID=W4K7J5_HETIT|nr:uncharacterized protein HETIRDRAFT_318355 [Heterobasidion irregulare TC 32-1]ETW81310.1 hypothetical protein HETIRDRAFT_318355 [Heterobasidion irregulare TC 32-1]